MQRKACDPSTPVGPPRILSEEESTRPDVISSILNDEKVKHTDLSMRIVNIPCLIGAVCTFDTVNPDDLILTATLAASDIAVTHNVSSTTRATSPRTTSASNDGVDTRCTPTSPPNRRSSGR